MSVVTRLAALAHASTLSIGSLRICRPHREHDAARHRDLARRQDDDEPRSSGRYAAARFIKTSGSDPSPPFRLSSFSCCRSLYACRHNSRAPYANSGFATQVPRFTSWIIMRRRGSFSNGARLRDMQIGVRGAVGRRGGYMGLRTVSVYFFSRFLWYGLSWRCG